MNLSEVPLNIQQVEKFEIHDGHTTPDNIEEILKGVVNAERIRTNKKFFYYNFPVAFDIETTSFSNQLDNGETQKIAIMYCWQMAINGHVIIGRTWEQLKQVYKQIVNTLGLSENQRLIIYVHNLSFEFQFIRKLFEWNNVFAIDNRKPIYARTVDGVEFRCSYLLSGYSLAKLGEQLRTYKVKKMVGELDYTLIRHNLTPLTEKEMKYCENDVLVVSAYIQEEIERLGNITKIPLTKTGYVRNYCRNCCLYEGSHKHNIDKYKQYRDLMNVLSLDVDEYKELKRGFQGGFTHASARFSGKTVENVDSIDFTSSYPFVMLSEQFPMSRGKRVEIHNDNELKTYLRRYCCLFDVKFINLTPKYINENYISVSRCFDRKNVTVNNGRVIAADSIGTTITDIDYSIIRETYDWDKMEIANFIIYKRGYLPTEFVKAILKLYSDKTTLKGVEGKEVEYLNGKGMLNSTYGMTVTDIVRDEITYSDEWETETPDYEKAIADYNNSKKRFLFYPWGVWVTTYARRNLWSGILSFGDDYIYSDTDSIKCLNFEKHLDYVNAYNDQVKHKLQAAAKYHNIDFDAFQPATVKGEKKLIGVWDWETKTAKYTRFKTLGAKRYMIEQNGKINITVSGVNKKVAVPWLVKTYGDKVFEAFDNDLYFPANVTGKMTHTYIDDEQRGTVTDYKGITAKYDELSGVHLEAAEYSLSISDAYIDYLCGFRDLK